MEMEIAYTNYGNFNHWPDWDIPRCGDSCQGVWANHKIHCCWYSNGTRGSRGYRLPWTERAGLEWPWPWGQNLTNDVPPSTATVLNAHLYQKPWTRSEMRSSSELAPDQRKSLIAGAPCVSCNPSRKLRQLTRLYKQRFHNVDRRWE